MSNVQQLLGTPLPASRSHRERSSAPSPYTPFQLRGNSSRDDTPSNLGSPERPQDSRRESVDSRSTSTSPPRPQPARSTSPTLSTTSTSTRQHPSRSTSSPSQTLSKQPAAAPERTREELRQQAQAVVDKSRIRTDPSLSTSFDPSVDRQLWELFVGP
ncbi:uncharacterized protein JCM15063_005616 [Sporobolomyces koalae]|uniref:uncharacterized protein n=1 Tax=Sporobolomyces koalae TaxID=500713 RepID=UPI0031798D9E